jgi:CO/xanthine dehydrogenase Mo-binding subunit/CO/xanthine dehydrogenase FAD-binding subunit
MTASVGARVRSIEWQDRTMGRAWYVPDLDLPGLLVARIVRSTIPHGRILSVDTAAAAGLPGVACVLTGADVSEVRYPHEGPMLADRCVFARGVVRFWGEEVAAVAAETPAHARAAAAAVKVRYQPLRYITTTQEALAADAPRLHQRRSGSNVSLAVERAYGDLHAASDRSHLEIRGRYEFGRQAHACMETNGTLAAWDAAAERLEVWTSTQSPYFVRKELAHVLGLEVEQVVVREVAVGGGFGSKSKITDHEAIAALLSIRTGRPVRLVLDRDEEFATTKCRHAFTIELATGATAGGQLTHRDAEFRVDNGAYNHSGASVVGAAVAMMSSLYRTPAVRTRARLVDTNKVPGGQFRGYGGPQVTFAIESQMDELADALGLDPIELRIRNANQTGDVTHSGYELSSARVTECLTAVRAAIDWDRKRQLGGSGRGVGVAVTIHPSGVRNYPDANRSEAEIELHPDGRAVVRFGGSDPGTGLKTVIAQAAAQELGLSASDFQVITMDTARTPFDLGSWSSRGTVMAGHAVREAAAEMGRRLREIAADKLGADPSDVRLADGSARLGPDELGFAELVEIGRGAEPSLRVTESATVNTQMVDPATGVANSSPCYSFAAHVVEVDVDTGTGEVHLLDVVAAHDLGRAVNPIAAEGQVIGGTVMGLGAALREQLVYEGGRPVTQAFMYYGVPRAADLPPVRPILIEHEDPNGPYGAKSVGETSACPPMAAVANAVAHATGVRIRELPLTPDRVLIALRRAAGLPDRRYHLWRRPGRWWIAAVRWAYPRGLHLLLHRWGTRLARPATVPPISRVDKPTTLAELRGLLPAGRPNQGSSAVLGGGTDLIPARSQVLGGAGQLISLMHVPELARITEIGPGDLLIGGAVTLAELARSPHTAHDPALREAVLGIASAQIREAATVGGNLCQGKRCWFYRSGFQCYKRGGSSCPCYAVTGDHRYHHAVLGAHRCQAVTPSDLATVFGALDARVHIASSQGDRVIPVGRLYTGPGETSLSAGEIVRAIEIPGSARQRITSFRKLRLWEGDFAIASAAVSAGIDAGRIRDVRIVLGAIAPVPYRAVAAERKLTGRPLTPEVIATAAQAWAPQAHPLPGNAWKVEAACALLRRTLEDCLLADRDPR